MGLAITAWAGLGCTATAEPAGERVVEAPSAIAGGYEDPTDTAVVGISWVDGGTLCSGTLIAPSVVLTARHCVSNTLGTVNGGVDCVQTTFGPLGTPSGFLVSTEMRVTSEAPGDHLVREVVGLPIDEELFCGNDVAILILAEPIEASEAEPIEPRVDSPLTTGEEYSAVGYGATDEAGAGSGVRRRRDGLFVECVGNECPAAYVTGTEWVGDTGICSGDSGGPALDLDGRAVGVTSRGAVNCEDPVYGHVYAWATWLKNTAVYAAGLGTYAPPAWTEGATTDPAYSAPVGEACATNDDCYTGICLHDDTRSYCTRPCNADAPCPKYYECEESAGVCRDVFRLPGRYERPDKDIRCGLSRPAGGGGFTPSLLLLLLALGAASWRRRLRQADGTLCADRIARSKAPAARHRRGPADGARE